MRGHAYDGLHSMLPFFWHLQEAVGALQATAKEEDSEDESSEEDDDDSDEEMAEPAKPASNKRKAAEVRWGNCTMSFLPRKHVSVSMWLLPPGLPSPCWYAMWTYIIILNAHWSLVLCRIQTDICWNSKRCTNFFVLHRSFRFRVSTLQAQLK